MCTPMFPSGYTDIAFAHWATIWLRVDKLGYSSLLHPCCETWLSSWSHCWVPVLLRGTALAFSASTQAWVPPCSAAVPYPYRLGRVRQPTVASSIAEGHDHAKNFKCVSTQASFFSLNSPKNCCSISLAPMPRTPCLGLPQWTAAWLSGAVGTWREETCCQSYMGKLQASRTWSWKPLKVS